ncbi:MAG TPA: uroporphyrinogen-III synthase [Steroidobacteraceae bacterium]
MTEIPASVAVGDPHDPLAPEGKHKRVVVTRAEPNDGPLSSQLRAMGLSVLLWPAVQVTVAETAPLAEMLGPVDRFDWIVFASRHAVAAVTALVPNPPKGVHIAAVGQSTAQVLRQRGWPVDLLPSESNAAALVGAFATQSLQGANVLFPASSRALPTIAAGLRQLGAQVTQLVAYRTEPAPLDVARCRAWIERDVIGAVTFASPSAVIELAQVLGDASFGRLLEGARAVAMGPTTARALAQRGRTAALADPATLRGLALTTFRLLQTRQ